MHTQQKPRSLLSLIAPKPDERTLIKHIQQYRVCTILGGVGFGKTALAFNLARKLIMAGICDGCVSNIPHTLPTGIYGDDGSLEKKVIVFDEAWQMLDSRTSMTNSRAYGGFARKFNCIWLFPSVHDIDKRLRAITIEPLRKSFFGNTNIWTAYMAYNGQKNEITRFTSHNEAGYGLYSTGAIPADDGGIERRYAVSYFRKTKRPYKFGEDVERQYLQAGGAEEEL